MGFAIIFPGLKQSLSLSQSTYAAARATIPALAPYATTTELLAALKLSSALTPEARDAIVLALIAAHKRSPRQSLWQALLLAAFEPMMRTLRGRFGKKGNDEVEQRIVVAFLEAVQSIDPASPPERVAVRLQRATANAVFVGERADRRLREMAEYDDDTHAAASYDEARQAAFVDVASGELAQMLSQHGPGDEAIDALLATRAGGESLRQYVLRTYANLSAAERETVYERLKQQCRVATRRLRARASRRPSIHAA